MSRLPQTFIPPDTASQGFVPPDTASQGFGPPDITSQDTDSTPRSAIPNTPPPVRRAEDPFVPPDTPAQDPPIIAETVFRNSLPGLLTTAAQEITGGFTPPDSPGKPPAPPRRQSELNTELQQSQKATVDNQPINNQPSRDQRNNSLQQSRSALDQQGRFLETMDKTHPLFRKMKRDFTEAIVEQQKLEREQELADRITLDGVPISQTNFMEEPLLLRELEYGLQRFAGTFKSGYFQLTGQSKRAIDTTRALDDLQEYNNLINENSIFGKKAGPVIGKITSSLSQGSANAASGGLLGIASLFALDSFNTGLKDGVDAGLSPLDSVVHGTQTGAITFATTMAGGTIAQKLGVSSGDGIAPYLAATSSRLFSKQGLGKVALSGLVEGGESAVESVMQNIELIQSGIDPNAGERVISDLLSSGGIGILGGAIGQVADSKVSMDVEGRHFVDTMEGWVKRLKRQPKPELKSESKTQTPTTPSKADAEIDTRYLVLEDGTLMKREQIEQDLHAASLLEQELIAQKESGGAQELRQILAEQEDAIDIARAGLKDVQRQIAVFAEDKSTPKFKNLLGRREMLQNHIRAAKEPLLKSKQALQEWNQKFDTIHKEELQFISEELNRLADLDSLPSPTVSELAERYKTPTAQEQAQKQQAEGVASPEPKTKTEAPQIEAPAGTPKSVREALRFADRTHVNTVREFFGLDNVPRRERQTNEFDFQKARELGFDVQALDIARESLQNNTLLDSVQIAGVQSAYVRTVDDISKMIDNFTQLKDTDSASISKFTADFEQKLSELDVLTLGMNKSSSEVGAALQAQKRMIAQVYSLDNAIKRARKLKGQPLTTEDLSILKSTSEEVAAKAQAATSAEGQLQNRSSEIALARSKQEAEIRLGRDLTPEELAELEQTASKVRTARDATKGLESETDIRDRADFELEEAIQNHNAAINNLAPPDANWLDAIEAVNAIGMAATLSGDLVPVGRQGFAQAFQNPRQTAQNVKAFFGAFNNLSVREARFQAFVQNRRLADLRNYVVLRDTYEVPILGNNTKFSDVEGSAIDRITQALATTPGAQTIAKLVPEKVKQVIRDLPGQQFEIAYKSWLNTHRMTMANLAFEQNKHLLSMPDGQKQMRTVINNVLNMSGHTKTDFGRGGRILLVAPKYLISRFAVPFKAMYHMPKGLLHTLQGRQSSSRWLAKQYTRTFVGAAVMAHVGEQVASLMFGNENAELDRDPTSSTFGMVRINNTYFDVTGGMATPIRLAATLGKGAKKILLGSAGSPKTKTRDMIQTIGGILGYRASPVARASIFAAQEGKELGSNEVIGLAEYAVRNGTFLSWQQGVNSMKEDGLTTGLLSFAAGMFGGGSFVKKPPKRKPLKL